MSKHLEKDLDGLQRRVLRMAALVEESVLKATAALIALDADAGRAVIGADDAVDRLENTVQEDCLRILALHQPVAGDLRRVTAILLIATDLERIGDLAVGIAERAVALAAPPRPAVPDRICRMTARATEMLRLGLDAFVRSDSALARRVLTLDDEVDADNAVIIAGLLDDMSRRPEGVEAGLALFAAVRNLERIADHATNIAEDVVYLVDGEQLRHRG